MGRKVHDSYAAFRDSTAPWSRVSIKAVLEAGRGNPSHEGEGGRRTAAHSVGRAPLVMAGLDPAIHVLRSRKQLQCAK